MKHEAARSDLSIQIEIGGLCPLLSIVQPLPLINFAMIRKRLLACESLAGFMARSEELHITASGAIRPNASPPPRSS